MKEMTKRYGGHCERKKNCFGVMEFYICSFGDTNDGRNIASASALKFQDSQEKSLEHYTWCLTWNAWKDWNGSTFEE